MNNLFTTKQTCIQWIRLVKMKFRCCSSENNLAEVVFVTSPNADFFVADRLCFVSEFRRLILENILSELLYGISFSLPITV